MRPIGYKWDEKKKKSRVHRSKSEAESQTKYTIIYRSTNASKTKLEDHEEVLYLQPLSSPKRFDISPPLTGGCSEGLGAI